MLSYGQSKLQVNNLLTAVNDFFFWKIISYILDTVKINVVFLHLNMFLLSSAINFTEDIYSQLSAL